MDHLIRRDAGQHGQPFGAQFGGRLEAAVGLQVVLEEAIDRTRDMAADRVDGLVLAPKTVRTAGVDQVQWPTPRQKPNVERMQLRDR